MYATKSWTSFEFYQCINEIDLFWFPFSIFRFYLDFYHKVVIDTSSYRRNRKFGITSRANQLSLHLQDMALSFYVATKNYTKDDSMLATTSSEGDREVDLPKDFRFFLKYVYSVRNRRFWYESYLRLKITTFNFYKGK